MSDLPMNTVGAKVPLFFYHEGCGWCKKEFQEGVNELCDIVGKAGHNCYGVNLSTKNGRQIAEQLKAAEEGVPDNFFCVVARDDQTNEPYLDCGHKGGYTEHAVMKAALSALGVLPDDIPATSAAATPGQIRAVAAAMQRTPRNTQRSIRSSL